MMLDKLLLGLLVVVLVEVGNGHRCNVQSDCVGAEKCVFRAGKGFDFVCEIKPDNSNKKCKCKVGCITCGQDHRRFAKKDQTIITGCGKTELTCVNPATNEWAAAAVSCFPPQLDENGEVDETDKNAWNAPCNSND